MTIDGAFGCCNGVLGHRRCAFGAREREVDDQWSVVARSTPCGLLGHARCDRPGPHRRDEDIVDMISALWTPLMKVRGGFLGRHPDLARESCRRDVPGAHKSELVSESRSKMSMIAARFKVPAWVAVEIARNDCARGPEPVAIRVQARADRGHVRRSRLRPDSEEMKGLRAVNQHGEDRVAGCRYRIDRCDAVRRTRDDGRAVSRILSKPHNIPGLASVWTCALLQHQDVGVEVGKVHSPTQGVAMMAVPRN
jgi:hypothetical protein